MYHTAYLPKHNYSFQQQQTFANSRTDSHKVFLLKQYILQLELHIAYLEKQLSQFNNNSMFLSVTDEMERSQKKELIEENIILESECIMREQELLLVIQDNKLLQQKLKTISSEGKSKTIQMLVQMNKKLQEVNLGWQKQILEYGKLEIVNVELKMEIDRWIEEYGRLKEELFEKRHVYSKFKLCLNQLNMLEIKYKKFDPSYQSKMGYNSCV